MKNLMKYIRFFIIIIATTAILMFIIFYALGYRFLPINNAIIDWEAINIVISWILPTIISLIAIWYAAKVPLKIAELQNKISLFDKRYDIYTTFIDFYKHNYYIENDYIINVLEEKIRSSDFYENLIMGEPCLENTEIFLKKCDKIAEAEFYFDGNIGDALKEYKSKLSNFILTNGMTTEDKKQVDTKEELLTTIKSIEQKKIVSQMKKHLKITEVTHEN